MSFLRGLVGGFQDSLAQTQRDNAQRAAQSSERERRIFATLAESDDPEIKSLAIAGMLSAAQDPKKKKGLRGWLGEVEGSPILNQIQSLVGQQVPTQVSQPSLPSRAIGGGAPMPMAQAGAMAMPGSSMVQGSQPSSPAPSLTQPSAVAPPPAPPGVRIGPLQSQTATTTTEMRPREMFQSAEPKARAARELDLEYDVAGKSALQDAEIERVYRAAIAGGMDEQSARRASVGLKDTPPPNPRELNPRDKFQEPIFAAAAVAREKQQRGEPLTAQETNDLAQARQLSNLEMTPEEQARQAQSAALARERMQITVNTAGSGNGSDDPKVIAQSIINGDQPPVTTGLYRMAGPVRAELARQGYDLTRASQDWRATERYLSTINSGQQVRLRQATEFVAHTVPLVQELSDELTRQLPRGRFPALNRAAISAAKAGVLGEAAQAAATRLSGQIADMQSELAVMYRGGYAATDEAMKKADDMLRGDWTAPQLKAALDLINRNVTIRLNSLRSAGVSGATEGNQYRPESQTSVGGPPPPPASRSISVTMTGPNGKVKTTTFPTQAEADEFRSRMAAFGYK